MPLMLILLLGLLGLVPGCGERLPATVSACPDAACRQRWVVDAMTHGEAEAAAAIEEIKDPIERIAIVSALTETYPGQTLSLCERLPAGASADRCKRINSRPHLWNAPVDPQPPTPRAAGGPTTPLMPVPAASTSPYAALRTGPGACSNRQDVTACVQARALREAQRGSASRAAGACASIAEDKWRAECMFASAEALILHRGRDAYVDATQLCVAAGVYASNCVSHTLIQLGDFAPDATDTNPAAWEDVRKTALVVRDTWKDAEGDLGSIYEARLWAEALRLAYRHTPVVTGGPIGAVPADVLPYVRAAAAARLVELDSTASARSLDELTDALLNALSLRVVAVERPRGEWFDAPLDLWGTDKPGDETVPAILHMGTSRRTFSREERPDAAICVLEAGARAGIDAWNRGDKAESARWTAILEQGQKSSDEWVRFTADRLVTRFAPGSDATVKQPTTGRPGTNAP